MGLRKQFVRCPASGVWAGTSVVSSDAGRGSGYSGVRDSTAVSRQSDRYGVTAISGATHCCTTLLFMCVLISVGLSKTRADPLRMLCSESSVFSVLPVRKASRSSRGRHCRADIAGDRTSTSIMARQERKGCEARSLYIALPASTSDIQTAKMFDLIRSHLAIATRLRREYFPPARL